MVLLGKAIVIRVRNLLVCQRWSYHPHCLTQRLTRTMARQPVKVTYAHKRGRAKATAKLASSPLEDLPPDRDDITRSEMSRRMLKRSRRISHEDDDQIRLNERAMKRARQTVEPSQPNAFPVGANINTLQTPFPSAEYVHLSSVTRPLVPENLSPVPHAKQILSRTSSRNLKENDTSLASPFHSRSSSPRSPATAKTKARSYRIPLHSKSRTLPSTLQKNDSTNVCDILLRKDSLISLNDGKLSRQVSLNDSKLSRNHAIPSLNQLARNSPSKYRRYTSNLNPSYMLSHTLQKDCISQLGTLAIHAGSYGPDPELLIRPCPTESSFTSPFLVDRPQFCSTPQHHLSGNRTGLQPPNPPSCMTFLTNPSHGARDEDFEMANCADVPKIPKIHIPGNSIISSSGSFTLRTRLNSHIPDVGDDHDINDSAGSAPMSISTDVLPQKVSMGDNILPSHSRALGMDNSGSHCKISLGQSAVPLSGTSLLVSPVVSTRTAIGEQSVAFPISSPAPDTTDSAARSARECIPLPLPPTRFGGSSGNSDVGVSSQADLVQDMLSLGLGGMCTLSVVLTPFQT